MMYVYIILGHRSFTTGKIAIVAVPDAYAFISDYADGAKKQACKELGLNEEEVSILDYKFLGSDVLFIK